MLSSPLVSAYLYDFEGCLCTYADDTHTTIESKDTKELTRAAKYKLLFEVE